MMPSLASRKRGWSSISAKELQVQAGGQGDAVDARVQRGVHARAQGVLGRVHGQLFHAVDEDQAIAALGFHGLAHMHAGGFGQQAQVELHDGLVAVLDIEFVLLELVFDVFGVEAAVGHRGHHGIGNMAHATQPGRFQRQRRGGDVHAHAAYHDGHQLLRA